MQANSFAFTGAGGEDLAAMLAVVKASSLDDLFSAIPEGMRSGRFDLPADGLPEYDMLRCLHRLASRNRPPRISACGAGVYDHFIPAAVNALASRGEFLTAYTPYQAEASQGTLQAIFEFQTAIARLTAMDAANASLYDGGTALFEGMMMAVRHTRRRKILVCAGTNPVYRAILRDYTRSLPLEILEMPVCEGRADREAFSAALDGETAAVILPYPNFFGVLDDLSDIIDVAHGAGALAVISSYPMALALCKPPGEMGADVVTGEAQCFGNPPSFGGPYLGYMAVRRELARKMPGRIVGMTHDAQGRRGYVLTLQTREQHIRREKATSNICTNQGLCALRAIIYLSLMGKEGLVQTAKACADRAAHAYRRFTAIPGVEAACDAPFFNEFAVALPCAAAPVVAQMMEEGIIAGINVGNDYPGMERMLLSAYTEKMSVEEIDELADQLQRVLERQ